MKANVGSRGSALENVAGCGQPNPPNPTPTLPVLNAKGSLLPGSDFIVILGGITDFNNLIPNHRNRSIVIVDYDGQP